jgi:RHH-type transcriptional regulator, proline utilization regulon repressor / proline dehydrogenase / delta 1-pyrroline-5-carboxylate dehydrogenase
MKQPFDTFKPSRLAINHAYLMDEDQAVSALLKSAQLPEATLAEIRKTARGLITEIREQRTKKSGLDAFLDEYDLSSDEGIALMCLAEAMLRIPDKDTIDDLIRDKITAADWGANVGKSDSFFVNASTWALMLTGKVVANPTKGHLLGTLKKLVRSSGEPIIRKAVAHGMKVLGKQFVMGTTIKEAVKRAKAYETKGYLYSYDMLGEAARTAEDAEFYFRAYSHAIGYLSSTTKNNDVTKNPGISVKLSALYPRYEFAQRDDAMQAIVPRVLSLAQQAMGAGVAITIDAEEARVLDLSLDIFEKVYSDPGLNDWEGLGLAVQSYQKRAPYVIEWLVKLYDKYQRRIMVRLIKGAYWDAEIKYAQMQGLPGYPVFTRKASTDVSFLACAKQLLAHPKAFYAQFGSHNAYSVASILALTQGRTDFEFQALHGMGHILYDKVVDKSNIACRIYAPVGGHRELLAYLVRRLLENGANTSFVNRIADEKAPIEDLLVDPYTHTQALATKPHPHIPLPSAIFSDRKNAQGLDLSNREAVDQLQQDIKRYMQKNWSAAPIVSGKVLTGKARKHCSPSDKDKVIGSVVWATDKHVEEALQKAHEATQLWDRTSVVQRADCLFKAADLLEQRMPMFIALMVREAGKTLPDSIAELREAVDFCRYYAAQALETFKVVTLPGYTGELNQLSLHGRGVIACISPWNFPLAIFMGQVTAALVAGNTVIAKPAEPTSLIAAKAVELLHEAGIPSDVLHLLTGAGSVVGAALSKDSRVKGIIFTGSTETARLINITLAKRQGAIVPLIAETGGQNAMIVDSSALFEQVVVDVIASAFGAAGQRCSSLRVLYVQDDIAEPLLKMLKGAMAELHVGYPGKLATDLGPVIDADALTMLEKHFKKMRSHAKLIYQVPLGAGCSRGHYFAPCAFEIKNIKELKREVFGPCLHVIRYKSSQLDQVLQDITDTGYGLTQGIHSRINEKVEYIQERLQVGNLYVNRNMIGAVVGVQPFGGEGLSGTGPKAGGPHYLMRLATERTVTVDTTASGGNASLLTLKEDD